MPAENATSRFSDRVEAYTRCRPSYPPKLMQTLSAEFGLRAGQDIADVGSGSGISARLFLEQGCRVFAVEPNDAMRAAAEASLRGFAGFNSINGTAESTGLPGDSVDWYVAAQAFHWFRVDAARTEARRILRPAGLALLVWNDRRNDTPFLADYERFLHEHGTDYAAVNHRNVHEGRQIGDFFGGPCETHNFPYRQRFEWNGLLGRVLSSSYIPGPGHPKHAGMLAALRVLFDRHAEGGEIDFAYVTRAVIGQIA
ncbi:MAG: class I SAM-dependent methyltransferase [Planctomycetes bacterium]|nr:class I SAM-dependent methyltransferase [Planctomycetota bacterium]